jgi:hypothetical protein
MSGRAQDDRAIASGQSFFGHYRENHILALPRRMVARPTANTAAFQQGGRRHSSTSW